MKCSRSSFTRAGFVAVLSAAVLATVLPTGSVSAQTAAPTKVNIGLGGFAFSFLPVMVADASKMFQQEGLDVKLISTGGGTNTMAALLGGSIDLGGIVFSDSILAATKRQKVQAVAPIMGQFASDAVLSKKSAEKAGITPNMPLAERLKRVKGMTLAITGRGSGQDKMWRYLITQAGMDPDRDVTLTVIRFEQLYPALRAERIDGFNSTSPPNNLAVKEGFAVWLARPSQGEVPGLKDFLYTSLSAKPAYIAANGDTIQKIVRSLAKAVVMIHDDPAGVARLMHQSFFKETDLATLELVIRDQRVTYPKSMVLDRVGFDLNMKFMTQFGDDVKGVTYADVVEPKFGAAVR